MPVMRCTSEGRPGWKWGEQGKCYTYAPNDPASRERARKRALAQGIAMGEIGENTGRQENSSQSSSE